MLTGDSGINTLSGSAIMDILSGGDGADVLVVEMVLTSLRVVTETILSTEVRHRCSVRWW